MVRSRSRRGTIIARVGSWTSVIKVVARRRLIISGTLSGLTIHLMNSGIKRSRPYTCIHLDVSLRRFSGNQLEPIISSHALCMRSRMQLVSKVLRVRREYQLLIIIVRQKGPI